MWGSVAFSLTLRCRFLRDVAPLLLFWPGSSLWFSADVCLRLCSLRSSTTATSAAGEDAWLKWGLLLVPLTAFCLGTWQVIHTRIPFLPGMRALGLSGFQSLTV